jgi:voltage-gated potassium channel
MCNERWVLTTMTTVGYGDFFPTTTAGKALGVVVFYCGIIFVCMPISIIGM